MNKWLLQILLFLSVLIPSYSFAADSDCVQDGGKVACVVAKQYWTNVYNDKAASFDELVAILRNRWCNGTYPLCDLKTYPGGTWNGLICWTASCTSAYTYKNLENGYIAFAYGALKTGCGGGCTPNQYYDVYGSNAIRISSCPAGYTAIAPKAGLEVKLCSPTQAQTTIDNHFCPSCLMESIGKKIQGVIGVGDPVNAGGGTKFDKRIDYSYHSAYPLNFTRIHIMGAVNRFWRNEYDRRLSYTNSATAGETIVLERPSLEMFIFKKINGLWVIQAKNENSNLTQINNQRFEYKNSQNETEVYESNKATLDNDTVFLLTKIIKSTGASYQLTYSKNFNLTKITDPYNRTLVLERADPYATCRNGAMDADVIKSLTGPNGKKVLYSYDNACRLTKVTYADNSFLTYTYDANNVGIATEKDALGNVIQRNGYGYASGKYYTTFNTQGDTGNNINGVSLSYTANTSQITDARGNSITMNKMFDNGITKTTGFNSFCTFCDGINASNVQYNQNGFVTQVTDFKGVISQLFWDETNNLMTSQKEAVNTALQRTTNMTWDTTLRKPTMITSPTSGGVRIVDIAYNVSGLPSVVKITAPTNDGTNNYQIRTMSYGYDSLGQTTDIKGPRYSPTINDRQSISYDAGRISTVINGSGHVTLFSEYDDFGNPQLITQPDGTLTKMTYDLMGRPTLITRYNQDRSRQYSVGMTYLANGAIDKMFSPDGSIKKCSMTHQTVSSVLRIMARIILYLEKPFIHLIA